ncbi:pseudouridine synthase [Mesobacterium pallidum]|uniref:pseudouridine synthase n=1 Tax=Mesobacterium pallidum TaxID=2872037 RepID=UPI001EE2A805|nr:pseudouridine synthase [Mesobacterium pallidum]
MSDTPPPGDRIAKVIARAGHASRREAERLIETGRVTVNGKIIDSPALNVTVADKITVNGKPLAEAEEPRLWLFHKPRGQVTTAKDEEGRPTIYDSLPEDLPRVMPVGRLDMSSEGLLLLTNDGGIKRKLELPSTGWLRKYRVRVNGRPEDSALEPLRRGVTIEGEAFQPMNVSLDRQQGANAWLTVGIREGRNREIRRAMAHVGLVVNRLIRVSYGPFQLGTLAPGAVEEVRRKILRDQLGLEDPGADTTGRAKAGKPGGKPTGKPGRPGGPGKPDGRSGKADGRPGKPDGRPGKAEGKFGKSDGRGGKSDARPGKPAGRFGKADDRSGKAAGFSGKPEGRPGKPGGGRPDKPGGKPGPSDGARGPRRTR